MWEVTVDDGDASGRVGSTAGVLLAFATLLVVYVEAAACSKLFLLSNLTLRLISRYQQRSWRQVVSKHAVLGPVLLVGPFVCWLPAGKTSGTGCDLSSQTTGWY
jgi:hypothetical protein